MSLQLPIRNDIESFSLAIALDGSVYLLQFDYNLRIDTWTMTVSDALGNPILAGAPILTNIETLAQYITEELPPGGVIAIDESGQNLDPTFDSFSETVKAIYLEAADLAT